VYKGNELMRPIYHCFLRGNGLGRWTIGVPALAYAAESHL
jgi:hypothetical protein